MKEGENDDLFHSDFVKGLTSNLDPNTVNLLSPLRCARRPQNKTERHVVVQQSVLSNHEQLIQSGNCGFNAKFRTVRKSPLFYFISSSFHLFFTMLCQCFW